MGRKRNIFEGVGSIKNISQKIKLIEGSEPLFLPLRRRTPAEQESERKEVKKVSGEGYLRAFHVTVGYTEHFCTKEGWNTQDNLRLQATQCYDRD